MKNTFIILTILFSINLYSQQDSLDSIQDQTARFILGLENSLPEHDTIRQYYNDSIPIYIYPQFKFQNHGICKSWYPNSQLKFIGNFTNGKGEGVHFMYYENGNLLSKTYYEFGKSIKYKGYHLNGKKANFNSTTSNSYKLTSWQENGKKLVKTRYKNGLPINCYSPLLLPMTDKPIPKDKIHCTCGGKAIFWSDTDSLYVDSLGNEVNANLKFTHKYWYKNGKLRSKMITNSKKGKGIRREWDEDGNLVIDETF